MAIFCYFGRWFLKKDDQCMIEFWQSDQKIKLHFNNIIQLFHLHIIMAETKAINEQYSRFKATLPLFPYKCRMFFSLLIGVYDEHCTAQVPKTLRKNYQSFLAAMKKLSPIERTQFISHNISFATSYINGLNLPPEGPSIHQIETTCETKSSFYGVSYWEKRNFKFQFANMTIKLSTAKRLQIVELKNYLVRQSVSEKDAFVLEATETYLPENRQKITIRFGSRSIFEELFGNIKAAMQELAHRRLEVMLKEEAKEGERPLDEGVVSKDRTFLTQKAINEYFDCKQEVLKKLRSKAGMTFTIYNKPGLQIRNSTQSNKYYFLDYTLPPNINSIEAAKQVINILGTRKIPNRYFCESLQSFAHNIWAKYYKICTDSLQCQQVMIVETLQQKGRLQKIMKATQNVFLGVNINFLNIELGKGVDNCFQLSLQGIVKIARKTKSKSRQATKLLLSLIFPNDILSPISTPPLEVTIEHGFPIRKKSNSQHKSRQEIAIFVQPSINQIVSKAEHNDSSDGNDDEEFYSIENEEMEGEVQNALNSFSAKNMEIPTHDMGLEPRQEPTLPSSQHISFLNVKPFLSPTKGSALKFISESLLERDWKKLAKGGVVCVNEEVISEQKKIFKLICKQFGNKLFKMQGVISFSLPVQICRPESALISIARNVTYAPLLFENFASLTPIELMKNTMIFQISMELLSLSTRSPFNPIIGETYQGQINGCPIYMEQISHHPPITYLLLQGRGYRVYGPICPQICIRLNYIKGINSRWLTIEFDNGEKLQFSVPTMIINGMLFGDRNIYFEGTNYVIDQKNSLLAEIIFNAGKKGFFGSKEDPDFLTGEIYQVTGVFMESFLANKGSTSPKKDEKNKLLASISGEWNGKLVLNDETLIDFETNLPLLLQNYPYPLQSDSIYREDAVSLIDGALDRAQEHKQRLEQLQRKDKKLREDYTKHTKHK